MAQSKPGNLGAKQFTVAAGAIFKLSDIPGYPSKNRGFKIDKWILLNNGTQSFYIGRQNVNANTGILLKAASPGDQTEVSLPSSPELTHVFNPGASPANLTLMVFGRF